MFLLWTRGEACTGRPCSNIGWRLFIVRQIINRWHHRTYLSQQYCNTFNSLLIKVHSSFFCALSSFEICTLNFYSNVIFYFTCSTTIFPTVVLICINPQLIDEREFTWRTTICWLSNKTCSNMIHIIFEHNRFFVTKCGMLLVSHASRFLLFLQISLILLFAVWRMGNIHTEVTKKRTQENILKHDEETKTSE